MFYPGSGSGSRRETNHSVLVILVRIKLLLSSTVPINCMFRNKAEQSDLLRTLILKKWKSQLSE